jgi:alkanesulfonate monooxygenase SsuD/methylene tetrahydromethanopterin reductase-like flavin-dependent oxidoreductase (luciferase family)
MENAADPPGNFGAEPQFGVHAFGEIEGDDRTHRPAAHTLRNIVEQAALAETVGLDFIGLGEHHRPDFAISQPDLVLASIASRTRRLRLGSAVTVLSADEPVRLYERFSTLDALSNGRAELAVGPGAFRDVFDLLGIPFQRRQELFADQLKALLELIEANGNAAGPAGLAGRNNLVPAITGGQLPIRVATTGSEVTLNNAADLSLPVMLAIRDGDPARFAGVLERYRKRFSPHPFRRAEVTLHMSGYVAGTLDDARNRSWPHVEELMSSLGSERQWDPLSRKSFEEATELSGAVLIGSADLVAQKIARHMRATGATRFALKYSIGAMSQREQLDSITLYGAEVVPRVRLLLRLS